MARLNAYRLPEEVTTRDGTVTREGGYRIDWDKDWQIVETRMEDDTEDSHKAGQNEKDDFAYMAIAFESDDGAGMKKLLIHVWGGEDSASADLFELEVSRYIGGAGV